MMARINQSNIYNFFVAEFSGFGGGLLFKDKRLLKEEKYAEFAGKVLKRSKRSFGFVCVASLCFVMIGVLYLTNQLIPGSPAWIGLSYLFSGILFLLASAREYYKIRGATTLLLTLLHDEPSATNSETVHYLPSRESLTVDL